MTELERLVELFGRRSSTRAFLPEPLPEATLRALLSAAQRAPSWCNVQPWRVVVTSPPTTARLTAALAVAAASGAPSPEVAFPAAYPSPYLEHRRACGTALFHAMGIARDDAEGRRGAWLRNYAAFDAPHLAIVSCDRRLGAYALVDVGVWLGYLLAAAAAAAVATCPMASLAGYPGVLRDELTIPSEETILLGVALGRADPSAAVNAARPARAPLEENVRLL